MSDIYSRVTNYISKHAMIHDTDSVLAAVSGGADSMCMLCLLIRYCSERELKLGVVHVDHGFRPESPDEARFVENFCDGRSIPFYLKKIEPGSCARSEEAARERRNDLITEAASEGGYTVIALAHNLSDRAETVMFNIVRGAGVSGLAGIRPVRDMFIRPVMCLDRSEIETFLNEAGVGFCTDSTKLENDYSRNRIRHLILPEALKINEGSIRHMDDLAEDVSDVCDLIEDISASEYRKLVTKTGDYDYRIDTDRFTGLHTAIRRQILRMILGELTPHLKDISREHILSLEALAFRDTNARIDLPYGIRAYRSYQELCIRGRNESDRPGKSGGAGFLPPEGVKIDIGTLIPGGESLKVKLGGGRSLFFSLEHKPAGPYDADMKSDSDYTKCFDYDKINKLLDVRYRNADDRMIIDEQGHGKKLSRYMIDARIPEFNRDAIPLVADASDVIWLVGYRDSYAYRIDVTTTRILKIGLVDSDPKGEKDG